MKYPKMFRLHQMFESRCLEDIPTTTRNEIWKLQIDQTIKPGQSVAIAVGSRGIANHSVIIKTIIEELQSLGAEPFIVPAMGSHGGGTAQGQAAILALRGISEETMGVPVRSSMNVVQIGTTDFGMPVFFDQNAAAADHVVLLNRVKPHTRFTGPIESGLMKMMAIGLGKCQGAAVYHKAFTQHSFERVIRAIYKIVQQQMPIAFGVAILENGYQQTAQITAIPAEEIYTAEQDLLIQAKSWCPQLPFNQVDLLIIDEIGKDISGAGMDTNVTGLKRLFSKEMTSELPHVQRIFVRDLTESSKGNAMGLGLADFTTKRLVDKIDLHATYTNALTGRNLRGAVIPVHFPTDQEVLNAAFSLIEPVEPENAKVLWIKNTLDLAEVEASVAYLQMACHRIDLTLLTSLRLLALGEDGNLPDWHSFGQQNRLEGAGTLDEEMKQELQRLTSIAEVTQVSNRYHFDLNLDREWRRMASEQAPLSLILVNVSSLSCDSNPSHHQARNACLQQVAKIINRVTTYPADLVACYDREIFGVILPKTDAAGAFKVAELIESEVTASKISHPDPDANQCLIPSLGVASITPRVESSPQTLIEAADQALYRAETELEQRSLTKRIVLHPVLLGSDTGVRL